MEFDQYTAKLSCEDRNAIKLLHTRILSSVVEALSSKDMTLDYFRKTLIPIQTKISKSPNWYLSKQWHKLSTSQYNLDVIEEKLQVDNAEIVYYRVSLIELCKIILQNKSLRRKLEEVANSRVRRDQEESHKNGKKV